ncbi:MAG: HAMP domain-containing protein [Phycisphaerales bacterium]
MLRKKLLARLGLLVVGFIAGAVVSILLLQGVLRDIDRVNGEATAILKDVQAMSELIEGGAPAGKRGADVLACLERLSAHRTLGAGRGQEVLQRMGTLADAFQSGSTDGRELKQAVAEVGQIAELQLVAEAGALSRRLRWLIVGLTVAALVMVNVSVVVLVGTANMILRPVGQLVAGSRELAQEHFAYRVPTDQDDEFGELARAYNRLAGQLGANEQRKVEALRQLAVTLNHELNNVLAIIELQLRLLDRRSADESAAGPLRNIHENLGRIATTIASLKNVRRIVLTDYMPGEKMLDLPRSVASVD